MTKRTLVSAVNTIKAGRITLFLAKHFGGCVIEDGVVMAVWRGKDYFMEHLKPKKEQ